MNKVAPLNHIQTAVAVIDKNMTVVEVNDSFKKRSHAKNIVGKKCFSAAYNFNENCNKKIAGSCPVEESFKTKKRTSSIHHFWIEDHAVVEEITATPIVEENGDVNYVVEEFRDVTQLLGLNKGILGICSYCRKIRNNDGKWLSIETYLNKHTGANFSHGICDECNSDLLKKI